MRSRFGARLHAAALALAALSDAARNATTAAREFTLSMSDSTSMPTTNLPQLAGPPLLSSGPRAFSKSSRGPTRPKRNNRLRAMRKAKKKRRRRSKARS